MSPPSCHLRLTGRLDMICARWKCTSQPLHGEHRVIKQVKCEKKKGGCRRKQACRNPGLYSRHQTMFTDTHIIPPVASCAYMPHSLIASPGKHSRRPRSWMHAHVLFCDVFCRTVICCVCIYIVLLHPTQSMSYLFSALFLVFLHF